MLVEAELEALMVVQQATERRVQAVLEVVAQALLQLMEQQAQLTPEVAVVVGMQALALEMAVQVVQG